VNQTQRKVRKQEKTWRNGYILWTGEINGYIILVDSRRRKAVLSFNVSVAGELKSREMRSLLGYFFCQFFLAEAMRRLLGYCFSSFLFVWLLFLLLFLCLGSAWHLCNFFCFCFYWYLFQCLAEICAFFLFSFYSLGLGLGCITHLHLKGFGLYYTVAPERYGKGGRGMINFPFSMTLLLFIYAVRGALVWERKMQSSVAAEAKAEYYFDAEA